MLKHIGIACAVVLLGGAVFMLCGCKEGKASSERNEYIVGKDIAMPAIKEFYYTIDRPVNPPEFQRYRFTGKDGKYFFYHEKREGNTWPLEEKHITVSGTVELSKQQWQEFFSYIQEGKVTSRNDNPKDGGGGPWTFLYWDKDSGKYQAFKFVNTGKKRSFEKFCSGLKQSKTE